ncbi:hypothetical protein [Sinorhizobium medicae]
MTSVEHMPPRSLFEGKQRPRGLEFPSCQKCQNSTRREELAVAMFSRIYPDSPTEKGRKEYQKIIRSVSRNHAGLLEEMNIDRLAVLRDIGEAANRLPTWNFLNCGGPLATTIISKFATKLAAALHFELTHEIVPRGAAIFVMHFTNYSAIVEGMPIDLLDALGVEKILAMGAQHSGGVFSYQSRRLNGEPTTIHMAYFRQSFALLLGVFPRFSDVPPQALAHIVIH